MNNIDRSTGCLISPKDLRDYKYVAGVAKGSSIDLPACFGLINKTVKDQGMVSSCVAHATTSALEVPFENIFSTGWIYGYRPINYYQGKGMYIRDALKTMKNKGSVLNNYCDVNIEMNDAKEIIKSNLENLLSKAEQFKIKSYASLKGTREIKEYLYTEKIPVIFSILEDGMILINNIVQIPKQENIRGAHCMIITGWNETGFIIQNSWGKDWGIHGTAILPYEYPIEEAWGIQIDKENNISEIKKPNYYTIRKILQKIWEIIEKIFDKSKK